MCPTPMLRTPRFKNAGADTSRRRCRGRSSRLVARRFAHPVRADLPAGRERLADTRRRDHARQRRRARTAPDRHLYRRLRRERPPAVLSRRSSDRLHATDACWTPTGAMPSRSLSSRALPALKTTNLRGRLTVKTSSSCASTTPPPHGTIRPCSPLRATAGRHVESRDGGSMPTARTGRPTDP